MLENLLEKLFIACCTGAATWCWARLKMERARSNANDIGTQMVLRFILVWAEKIYVKEGWISHYDRETIEACWEAYEALGKNGVINKSYKNIMALPSYPPDEVR